MPQEFASLLRKLHIRTQGADTTSDYETGELKPGERRNVAILYLDLGGFTSISEKLDHEEVHDIAKGIMDTLVDISCHYGGYVDKIEGDRIMVLFGARKAGENDSMRAVTCGLRMLDAIQTASDILSEIGISVTARIGINTGSVTVAPDAIGHLTAMGNAVNLASRMEEAADVNTILVTRSVQEKCGNMVIWKDMGDISLKGVSNPVLAFRPTGLGNISGTRWERIARVTTSTFVGRTDELSILEKKLNMQACSETGKNPAGGPRHIVLGIKGEAGIGKSRLVWEFSKRKCCMNENILVLNGHTLSFAQPAYWLWTTVLRDFFGIEHGSKPDYKKLKDKILSLSDDAALLSSLPFLADLLSIKSDDHKLEELDIRTRALETRIAFCNLFRVLSKEKRLLIILDDLHWIDSTCRIILEFVIANCSTDSAIMFNLLYRPERENGEAVEFDIKPSSADLEEITISEIDDRACRELLEKILSGISERGSENVAREVESFLLEHAEGNPFFLEELVLDLAESDVLKETNGHWDFNSPVGEIYIPSTLAGLLQSRLDHLPLEWKSVLQKSSVLGVEFQLKLYSKMVKKLSLDFNRNVFRNLELKKFLIGKGTAFEQKYFFRNILIHDTAYNSILESNKKLLHQTAAESVMNLYAEEEEKISGILVHHWEMAGDIDQAILWGMKALNHAAASYQHSVILDLSRKLQKWLQELPEQPKRNQQLLEVLTKRHVTLGLLGRREEQEKLLFRMYGIAEENLLQEWYVEIQRDLGDLYRETGRMTEAREYYEKARENAHKACDRSGEGKTLTNLGNLNYVQTRLAEAQECYEKALDLHREVGNRRSEGITLGNLGNLFKSQRRTSEAYECYMKALEIHQELGNRRSEGIVYANLGNLHFNQNVLDESRMCYENALRIAMDVGDSINQGITFGNLGNLHRIQNRPEKSLECYNSAIRISCEIGDVVNECLNLGNLGILLFDQDRSEEALSCYTQAYSNIIKLELGMNGLDKFAELRGKLLSSDAINEDIPWPIHWDPPGE